MAREPMDDLIKARFARGALAGVAAAFVERSGPPEMAVSGVAHVGHPQPVTEATVFRIASVTKTMTAIGTMQRCEAGSFSLDDPVNRYLKTFKLAVGNGWPDVTFRHLLTHTAGIGQVPRLADLFNPAAFGVEKPGSQGVDLASLYRGALRPEVRPGTKWAYANHGFAVLGQLITDVSGTPLPEYMRERVFHPLGMTSTDYLRTGRVSHDTATGHRVRREHLVPVRDYDRSLLGPGAVRSTIADMARYLQALLRTNAGEDAGVLRTDTLHEMWSTQYTPDPRLPGMGLGFFLHDFGGHRVVGHDGNLPGFASAILLAPDDEVGVVILANTATPFGCHLLAEDVLREALDLPARRAVASVPRTTVNGDSFVGSYAPARGPLTNVRTWQLIGGEIEAIERGGGLALRALSPVRELRSGVELRPSDLDDATAFDVDVGGMVVPIVFRRDDDGATMCVGHPMLSALRQRSRWRSARLRRRALVLGLCVWVGLRIAATAQSRRTLTQPFGPGSPR